MSDDLKRYLRSFDLPDDALFVVDSENRVVFWNRRAETLYGISSQEAVSRPLNELIQVQQAEFSEEVLLGNAHSEGSWRGKAVHIVPGRKTLFVDWTIKPIDIPECGFSGVLSIVKERRAPDADPAPHDSKQS